MAANGLQPIYACHCLNVRITPEPTNDNAPTVNKEFEAVHVGDFGINITHVQATLRFRGCPVREGHSQAPPSTRFMSLTCLICQTLVYRVKQGFSATTDGNEGPVIPGDDWAEHDILKSATGWVEVSKGCLTANAVLQTEASPAFSKPFRIVVPSGEPTLPFPPSRSASPSCDNAEVSLRHLPPTPPLFAPAPFTPSHPVFKHFSALALAESERARDNAEEYMSTIAQEKAAELQAKDAELKREVKVLWSRYKEGVDRLRRDSTSSDRPTSSMTRRRSGGQKAGGSSHGTGPGGDSSGSVRINDFLPDTTTTVSRMSSATPSHLLPSALSASLATSAFHYPGERDSPTRDEGGSPRSVISSPPTSSSPGHSSVTLVVSPSLTSSRSISMPGFDAEANIRDAHRRNMDESKDIATSYKYVLDLEAEMAERQRVQHEPSSSVGTAGPVSPTPVPRGRSPRGGKSSIKKGKEKENERPATPTKVGEPSASAQTSVAPKEVTPKGKRKVTFDIKPDVAIIGDDAPDGEWEREASEEAAIFDMEGEESPDPSSAPSSPTNLTNGTHTIASTSQPTSPVQRRRPRMQDPYGLPSAFSSLRPSSLPNLQSIRPPGRRVASDRSHVQTTKESSAKADPEMASGDKAGDEVPLSPDSQEAHVLNLVAASVPSHRSAWKRDSRAWQLYVERQGRRGRELGPVSIEEEEESDNTTQSDVPRLGRRTEEFDDDTNFLYGDDRTMDHTNGVTSSLPIPMMRHIPGASLRPKTSLTERLGTLVPPLQTSSSVVARRQVYAERDRTRQVDFGAFEMDDAADDEAEDDDREPDPQVGSLAAKRALQILEAADGVPGEGMWRSMAA